jgi:biopolymer transport protein ExbB
MRLLRGMHSFRAVCLGLALLLLGSAAHAAGWWNDAWTQRTRFVIDTSAAGVAIGEAVPNAPVALRLHSGNFDFVAAKEDGSDLRVLAADDKTPLPFRIERFDGVNELAVIWVALPSVLPGSDKNVVHVYAGNATAAAEPRPLPPDATSLLSVHFDDKHNRGADVGGTLAASAPVTPETNALLAGGARLAGTPIVWGGNTLALAAGGSTTVSLWLRPDSVERGTVFAWGPLSLSLQAGRLTARLGSASLSGGELRAASWTHLALAVGGGKARLLVGGTEVASADIALPAVAGELRVGEGIAGAVDELQVANTARSAPWLLLAAASQGSEGKLVKSSKEAAGEARAGESPGYMAILVKNLTVDAWVVIGILAVMLVHATFIVVGKLRFVARADKANRAFLARFRDARGTALLQLEQAGAFAHSSLFRLYQAGVKELNKRDVGQETAKPLSGASIDAVKASVDADLVRESFKLNSQMVWLTIAISGGPFLGLLGTVVGVMITFAAIAAAGDVNVNAIAPGIAAALLATVAGLAVAIPALFAYNYLASRIQNVSSDMQIFVDEFITKVAEQFGAR